MEGGGRMEGKKVGLFISPVLNRGLQGSLPRSFLTPNSPTHSSSFLGRLLLWGEGRQELTKENETLDSSAPLPQPQVGSPSSFPPNLHQTTLTPGLQRELVFLVVAAAET